MQGAVIEETWEMMHQTPINAYCYNPNANCFVTTDEHTIKLWNTEGETRSVTLPARTSYLIQTIQYISSRNMYMSSALDGSLRFYDESLVELASIFTHRATILCLVFDEPRNRIISGGIDGCSAWLLRGRDTEGYDDAHVIRNPSYQVAPLELFNKTGTSWVRRMKIDADANRLLVLSDNTLFVYNLSDATLVDTYKKLVKGKCGAITDFLVFKKKSIVASCMDGSIYVVTIYPRSTVAVFKEHTKTVTSLVLDPLSGLLMSSSLDSSMRMWDLDLLRNVHQLRLDTPLSSLFVVPHTNPVVFACQARQAMKLLTLKHTLKEHSTLASPIAILTHVTAPSKPMRHVKPANVKAAMLKHSTYKTPSMRVVADALTEQRKLSSSHHDNHVISICLDKSIRIYGGTDMAVPATMYVPEDAQDVVGVAFNSYRDLLYILMRKHILVFDVVEDIVTPQHVIDVDNRTVKCIGVCLVVPQFYAKPRHSQAASRRRLNSIVDFIRKGSSITGDSNDCLTADAWVVCGTDKGELLFSATSHGSLDEAPVQQAHSSAVSLVAFTAISTGLLVTYGMDKTFCFWRMSPRVMRVGSLAMGDHPTCIHVAPASQIVVCGFEDGRVDYVDFADAEPLVVTSEVNHAALVTAADSCDPLHLHVTTSFDMTLKVWDQQKSLLREVQMATPLTSLCFINSFGDLFVGMQAKMFSISRQDILPAKLPLPRPARTTSASSKLGGPRKSSNRRRSSTNNGCCSSSIDQSSAQTMATDLTNTDKSTESPIEFYAGDEDDASDEFEDQNDDDMAQSKKLDGGPPLSPPSSRRATSPTRIRRPVQVHTADVVLYNPPVLRQISTPDNNHTILSPLDDCPQVSSGHDSTPQSPQLDSATLTPIYDSRQFRKPVQPASEAMMRYRNRKERQAQQAAASPKFKTPAKANLTCVSYVSETT
ncbi:hypothetical protein, variant 1 [Aphanomyces invadans]|uniref:Uncharacterized protein n=1 Tax=Aphanomyces invadans TaxID=157072 RepID=A0A024U7J2_9STRA|nr:hypothetical protein, variant 1 [Aphanomyces invadans]ETW02239.1 hypothetical protein, variant 1 [Aphanomyces invadans]|eukprot:XP_008868844.1 hypothetical protein, variant 1 [Aphanomyces invadans]